MDVKRRLQNKGSSLILFLQLMKKKMFQPLESQVFIAVSDTLHLKVNAILELNYIVERIMIKKKIVI